MEYMIINNDCVQDQMLLNILIPDHNNKLIQEHQDKSYDYSDSYNSSVLECRQLQFDGI